MSATVGDAMSVAPRKLETIRFITLSLRAVDQFGSIRGVGGVLGGVEDDDAVADGLDL